MKKILCIFFILFVFPNIVFAEEDIYDVILFWGQSNMVGFCGKNICSDGTKGEDSMDIRLEELGIEKFSQLSGIDIEIVKRYKTMGYVNVPMEENSVYEYNYSTDSLINITDKTRQVGEDLYPHIKTNGNVIFNTISVDDNDILSTARSYGTNMTAWFAKTYYEKTGHKVIIVMGAIGGQKIESFLPHGAKKTATTTTNKNYLFEAMTTKYESAINYLESHNMKVGNKFDIVMQGESNIHGTTSEEWEQTYIYIHNKLKEKFGMKFSVIVQTSYTNGLGEYKYLNAINEAQNNVIKNNEDIILGSSYAWDRYVPSKENYSGFFLGEQMDYNEALEQAFLSASISPCSKNKIHFNSAALSQMGLESADNVIAYMKNMGLIEEKVFTDNYNNIFSSIKVNGNEINLNQNNYKYIIKSDVKKVKVEATLVSDKIEFVENFGPRTTDITSSNTEVILKVLLPDNSVRNYVIEIIRNDKSKRLEKGYLTLKILLSLVIMLITMLIFKHYFFHKK